MSGQEADAPRVTHDAHVRGGRRGRRGLPDRTAQPVPAAPRRPRLVLPGGALAAPLAWLAPWSRWSRSPRSPRSIPVLVVLAARAGCCCCSWPRCRGRTRCLPERDDHGGQAARRCCCSPRGCCTRCAARAPVASRRAVAGGPVRRRRRPGRCSRRPTRARACSTRCATRSTSSSSSSCPDDRHAGGRPPDPARVRALGDGGRRLGAVRVHRARHDRGRRADLRPERLRLHGRLRAAAGGLPARGRAAAPRAVGWCFAVLAAAVLATLSRGALVGPRRAGALGGADPARAAGRHRPGLPRRCLLVVALRAVGAAAARPRSQGKRRIADANVASREALWAARCGWRRTTPCSASARVASASSRATTCATASWRSPTRRRTTPTSTCWPTRACSACAVPRLPGPDLAPARARPPPRLVAGDRDGQRLTTAMQAAMVVALTSAIFISAQLTTPFWLLGALATVVAGAPALVVRRAPRASARPRHEGGAGDLAGRRRAGRARARPGAWPGRRGGRRRAVCATPAVAARFAAARARPHVLPLRHRLDVGHAVRIRRVLGRPTSSTPRTGAAGCGSRRAGAPRAIRVCTVHGLPDPYLPPPAGPGRPGLRARVAYAGVDAAWPGAPDALTTPPRGRRRARRPARLPRERMRVIPNGVPPAVTRARGAGRDAVHARAGEGPRHVPRCGGALAGTAHGAVRGVRLRLAGRRAARAGTRARPGERRVPRPRAGPRRSTGSPCSPCRR